MIGVDLFIQGDYEDVRHLRQDIEGVVYSLHSRSCNRSEGTDRCSVRTLHPRGDGRRRGMGES